MRYADRQNVFDRVAAYEAIVRINANQPNPNPPEKHTVLYTWDMKKSF